MKKHSKRVRKAKNKNPLDEQLLRVIGRNIVAMRNTLGMSQQLHGLEADIPQSTMSKTDAGLHDLRVVELRRLAEVMQCSIPQVLELHEAGRHLVVTLDPETQERSVSPRSAQG